MQINRFRHFFPVLFLTTLSLSSFGCSGEGDAVIDPAADERTETALIAVNNGTAGELAHYYEVQGLVDQVEYRTANGEDLSAPVDALYEAYGNIYMHSNATGEIVVLDLKTRKKLGKITGLPTPEGRDSGTVGRLCGMAFSNLSQAWVVAYGANNLYLVDARNFVLVRAIPLPGNPTAVTTIDNRVFVTMENADGTGSIGMIRSNDPDFTVEIKGEFPRPPFFAQVNPDGEFLVMLVPGRAEDDPATNEIDTDPRFFVFDLFNYTIAFELPFLSPPLLEYVGKHPNFAYLSKDSYLYLASSEGIKRIDTKSWGVLSNFFSGKSYSVVAADYWTDLVYAVPTDALNTVERKTKQEQTLPSFTLDNPVSSIIFVSTSKVGS